MSLACCDSVSSGKVQQHNPTSSAILYNICDACCELWYMHDACDVYLSEDL
jgi:hypothetical protein